jgi:uncharacterized Zn-binding protein involved in type VI secretion
LTAHGDPLKGGTGSTNVFIGGLPAWRGVTAAQLAAIMDAVKEAAKKIAEAQAEADAAAGTPAAGAAKANLAKTIAEQLKNVAAAMAGTGADMHACPLLPPPHGTGVVITGSQTVLINGLAACRVGDSIQEVTAVNTIAIGLPTVIIGG